MFRTNIFGYRKKDVNEFVCFSINSVIKLRSDINFLKNEYEQKQLENEKLKDELRESNSKLAKMGLINSHLIKLKNSQSLK